MKEIIKINIVGWIIVLIAILVNFKSRVFGDYIFGIATGFFILGVYIGIKYDNKPSPNMLNHEEKKADQTK